MAVKHFLVAFIFVVAMAMTSALHLSQMSQSEAKPSQLLLRAGHVDIPLGQHGWHDRPLHTLSKEGKSQVLVHMKGPINHKDVGAVEIVAGSKTLFYLPHNTFVMYLDHSSAAKVAKLPQVLWIGHYREEFKHDVRTKFWHVSQNHKDGMVKIAVALLPHVLKSYKEASETAYRWLEEWKRNEFDSGITTQRNKKEKQKVFAFAGSPSKLGFSVSQAAYYDFLNFLKSKEIVHFIEPYLDKKKFSDDITGITQTGQIDDNKIWDNGLHGENITIGIGDTGLDYHHCMFDDNNVTVNYCRDCTYSHMFTNNGSVNTTFTQCSFTSTDCLSSSSHRKVAAYWAFLDDKDVEAGHGTHVCGVAAGGTQDSAVGAYNGSAFAARIAFIDLNSAPLVGEGVIVPPLDTKNNYFPFAYNLGARIHTNSWGSGSADYSLETQDIDAYVHDHKEFLVLFPVGNNGELGLGSVSTQAAAKNALSVGATRTSFEHAIESAEYQAANNYLILRENICNESFFNSTSSSPLTWFEYINSSVDEPFNNISSMRLYYCDAIQTPSYCCNIYNSNNGSRDMAIGEVVSFLNLECCVERIRDDLNASRENELYGYNVVAQFSAIGPTRDARIKPDILAPGDMVVSARASCSNVSYCGLNASEDSYALTVKSGTSIAAASAAGNAALVRQYYLEGYGVCGRKNITHKPNFVSAALIKATMIASAERPRGRYNFRGDGIRNMSTQPFDIFYTGHGLIQLSQALRFANDSFVMTYFDYNSQVNPQWEGLVTGVQAYYNFTIETSNEPLKVVLVWSDVPGSPSAINSLVNDLDLEVVTPNSTILGNSMYQIYAGRDTVNNVEVVTINNPEPGDYSVIVKGTNIPAGPQDFALFLTYGSNTSFDPDTDPICLGTASIALDVTTSSAFHVTPFSLASLFTPMATLIFLFNI